MKPTNLILIGGGAAAVWWWWNNRPPIATGSNTTATPASATTPTTTTATTTVASAYNSLDAIYARLSASVKAAVGDAPQSSDTFNWYLAQQLGAGQMPPDPCAVFQSCGRDTPMTLAQYWTLMAPYLKTNMGLSGLGFFAGLGFASRAVQ